MDSVVKNFLRSHKTLIQYVYNDFGYKYACVVATSPTNIGWSKVHHIDDVEVKEVQPWQLPSIQKLKRDSAPEDFPKLLLQSPAYKKLINAGRIVGIPLFNKELGLQVAINRALNKVVTIKDNETMFGDIPNDEKLIYFILNMFRRAQRATFFA